MSIAAVTAPGTSGASISMVTRPCLYTGGWVSDCAMKILEYAHIKANVELIVAPSATILLTPPLVFTSLFGLSMYSWRP